MKRRAAGWGCAAILLVFLVAIRWILFPHYEPLPASGPHPVATARDTYIDLQRSEPYARGSENRRVHVAFWYPAGEQDNQTFPLVVFSHGGLATEYSNESLYRELASHGYVVCSIGHPYHALWTKDSDGRITYVSREYFGELQRENAQRDAEQSYHYYQKWMQTRTADIDFVIDAILERAAKASEGEYARIDVSRIGVIGHSLGGSAALAIPRLRDDVSAVIALESPFLYDITGVEPEGFVFSGEGYPVPVLNIYSDSSWPHLAEWPQYARNHAFLAGGPQTAHNLHIPGAGHFTLTDLALSSPLLARALEGGAPSVEPAAYIQTVNQACLAFFDQYLQDQIAIKEHNR